LSLEMPIGAEAEYLLLASFWCETGKANRKTPLLR
jgi:hypothetical protein